jgi:hypothetical protein
VSLRERSLRLRSWAATATTGGTPVVASGVVTNMTALAHYEPGEYFTFNFAHLLRNFEAFKYLHISLILDIKRK